MDLLIFPTKINLFVAVVLQYTGVKEVKLETLGRNEVRLNFTVLYVSHRERKVHMKIIMQVLGGHIQYISLTAALRMCLC